MPNVQNSSGHLWVYICKMDAAVKFSQWNIRCSLSLQLESLLHIVLWKQCAENNEQNANQYDVPLFTMKLNENSVSSNYVELKLAESRESIWDKLDWAFSRSSSYENKSIQIQTKFCYGCHTHTQAHKTPKWSVPSDLKLMCSFMWVRKLTSQLSLV